MFLANVLLDEAGRIVEWNGRARRLFGFADETAVGRHASLLYGGGNGAATTLLAAAAAVGHTDYDGECVREDGSAFDGRTLATAFRGGRDVSGFSLVIQNLAERSGALPRLRKLYADTLDAREDERARVASELRNALGERLTALRMDLHWLERRWPVGDDEIAERIAGMKQLMDATVVSTRLIAADLRPAELDNLGLVPALERLLDDLTARTGITVSLDPVSIGAAFREPLATTVYRMLQTVLVAVARRANGTAVHVALKVDGDNLVIGVRGNLESLDLGAPEGRSSCPVRGVKEWARALDGRFDLNRTVDGEDALEIAIPR